MRQAERFIREWQGPIYGYVLRMLRDEAAAADVTQEVFASAIGKLGTVSVSHASGWIYKIATHAVYKHLRGERRRQERERRVAMERPRTTPGREAAVEQAETRQILEDHLDALPADSRSLLMLHYYSGLSQREMATALSAPRTTIASRLERALAELKRRMKESGHLALIPGMDVALRSTPAPPVPPLLTQQLLALAASSGPVASIAIGGTIMTTKLLAGLAACTLVAFLAGWGANEIGSSASIDEHEATREQLEQARLELNRARDKSDELTDQLELARLEEERLAQALAKAHEQAKSPEATGSAPVNAVAKDLSESPGGIDWDALSKLSAENRDIVAALAESIAAGQGNRGLDPELMARHRAMIAELDKAAAMAKVETPYPILDEEFLPRILNVYLNGFLELDPAQREALVAAGLEARQGMEIPEDATPLEAYRARLDLLGDFSNSVRDELSEDQLAQWEKVQPLWGAVTEGSFRDLKLGFQPAFEGRPSESGVGSRVLDEWSTHYGIRDDQRANSQALVDEYLTECRGLLDRYGQSAEDSPGLSPEDRAELDHAFYELQREYEDRMLPLLDPDQLQGLQRRDPLLFRFEVSGSVRSINSTRNAGF